MNKVVAFLPMRQGSQRVKNKNIKSFSDVEGGLSYIKISQLLKVESIDQIVVSTDDKDIMRLVDCFDSDKIVLDKRPEELATSLCSTDDLIKYVPTIIKSGIVLWTHATSPFIDEFLYRDMVDSYLQHRGSFDSLMSVTKLQKFLWNGEGSINYDRSIEKWPRTQTLEPVFEINSGVFIADIEIYKKFGDRIGESPYFYELGTIEAFDIDWEDDFEIAEFWWRKRYGRL